MTSFIPNKLNSMLHKMYSPNAKPTGTYLRKGMFLAFFCLIALSGTMAQVNLVPMPNPATVDVQNGNTFSIEYFAEPVNNTQYNAIQLFLSFDPAFLTVTNVTVGSSFSFIAEEDVDNTNGTIAYEFGAIGLLDQEALAATIEFQVVGPLGMTQVSDNGSTVAGAGMDVTGNVAVLDINIVDGSINNAPVVDITAPMDGAVFTQGENIAFEATATDFEDDDATLTANIAWESSLDGSIGNGGMVSTDQLTPGTHTITASVTDSGGEPGSDQITITINAAPTVTITAPNDGATFVEGDNITFEATASDPEDGDLSASISWSSVPAGVSGTGSTISTDQLTPGSYTITAIVTDSGNQQATDQITITVDPAPNFPPVIDMIADRSVEEDNT